MSRALALGLLVLVGCRQAPPAEPSALTLEQVEAKLGQPNVFLFDANPREFYDHGHLPNASWVPFNAVTAALLPPGKDATLIFYCANELCTASHDAAKQALALGYANTFVMPEGFIGWKKSGRALVRPGP